MELFKLLGTIAIDGTERAKSDINDTVGAGQNAESSLVSSFKKIGSAVATYFAVDKIIAFGQDIVSTSATVSAEVSAFNQIMSVNAIGDYSDKAQEKLNKLANEVGMMSTRLTPYMTSMTAKFKGLGYDIDDATDMAVRGLGLATDASAFWDMSLDESMSHLNSFVNGSYEGGEAIGLFANETQLASYAIKTGLIAEKKEWANLDESIKQATRLEYAESMFKLSGAVGQANKESGQYANTQADLSEKWRQFKALIGEPLLQNVVTPAMGKLSEVVDKLTQGYNDLTTWVGENQDTINEWKGILEQIITTVGLLTTTFIAFKTGAMIQGVINSFQQAQVTLALYSATSNGATIAQGLFNGTLTIGETLVALFTGKVTLAQLATQGWTTAQTMLNTVLSANPIGIVIGLLVALAGVMVVAYNKSETFRNFVNNLWISIQQAFAGIVETMGNAWNTIIEVCTNAWETLKAIVQVGLMFISELVNFFIDILLIPWNFIWKNFGDKLTSVWGSMKTTVNNGITWIKNIITSVMTSIYNFFAPKWDAIKTTVSNVMTSVRGTISSVWNSIKTTISSVINNIRSTVSNVFNSVRSTISSVFNGIKSTATSIWNSIKTAITSPVTNAVNTVRNLINRIKGFFNFSWSLPKLKLPHVTIKGKFSLVPPSVPSFGISWYKKAMDNPMLLDKPTIFGMQNGKLLGGGEAGEEVVSGKQTLMNMIREAVGINDMSEVVSLLKQILAVITDEDKIHEILVKALTDGSFAIVLDNREVGRIVRKYA